MPYINQFFDVLVREGASDLHIGQGQPPKIRKHGDVMPIRETAVTREEAVMMLREICGPKGWEIFEERGDLDFAYEMDESSRFRCNFLKQTNGYGAVFRLIPTRIATLEELGIPPVVRQFGDLRGSLVLVTGPTGSGKSTTLAALIDYINSNYSRHIVTIVSTLGKKVSGFDKTGPLSKGVRFSVKPGFSNGIASGGQTRNGRLETRWSMDSQVRPRGQNLGPHQPVSPHEIVIPSRADGEGPRNWNLRAFIASNRPLGHPVRLTTHNFQL